MSTSSNVPRGKRSIKAQPDAPSMHQIEKFDNKQQNMRQNPNTRVADQPTTTMPNDTRRTRDYPYHPFPRQDAQDSYQQKRTEVLNKHAGQWQYQLQPQDIEYVIQKEQQQEYANKELWASQFWDDKDPARVAWFKQLMPDYFEKRKENLKSTYDLAYRLACLKMMGPQSQEDTDLMWALERGRIKIPAALYDPTNLVMKEGTRDAFARGPFSPKKWFKIELGDKVDAVNLFGGVSNGTRATGNYIPGNIRPQTNLGGGFITPNDYPALT